MAQRIRDLASVGMVIFPGTSFESKKQRSRPARPGNQPGDLREAGIAFPGVTVPPPKHGHVMGMAAPLSDQPCPGFDARNARYFRIRIGCEMSGQFPKAVSGLGA